MKDFIKCLRYMKYNYYVQNGRRELKSFNAIVYKINNLKPYPIEVRHPESS